MKKYKIGFIGGGRITRIMLQAFKNRSVDIDSIKVFEPDNLVSARLKEDFPDIEITSTNIEPAQQDILFIAVHPPLVMEVVNQVKDSVPDETILFSLAPKITIEKMSSVYSSGKIARMIPNATSFINRGFNPVCFNQAFHDEEKKALLRFLKNLGKTIVIEEDKLEAYAIVSAMLPTYFWFQWKKMEDIAQKIGLEEAESRNVIRSTLVRAIKLYYNSGLSPDQVIDLIPVKPIGENESEIEAILENKLSGLYQKLKP